MERPCSSTLPPLPLEVKAHILRFCDAPTLAATSRVSLAFLELSGPLLYRHVHIEGVKTLEKLTRSETLATVAPFVSLAQMRSLTYTLVYDHEGDEGCPADYHDARVSEVPISLDALTVVVANVVDMGDDIARLLGSFDPCTFSLTASGSCSDLIPDVELQGSQDWRRIRSIVFTGTSSSRALNAYPVFFGPGDKTTSVIDVVYDYTCAEIGLQIAYSTIIAEDLETGGSASQKRLGVVEIRLASEDAATLTRAFLEEHNLYPWHIVVKPPVNV